MAIAPGVRLGPYEIAAQIGVGGMGEVYRATDTTLNRQVAIKVLPESVAQRRDVQRGVGLTVLDNRGLCAHAGCTCATPWRVGQLKTSRMAVMKKVIAFLAVSTLLAAAAGAQGGRGQPADNPLVRENATERLAEHTYVIPDNNVSGVPNVGIVVGDRAALVIDPGMGRRNGETVLRELRKIAETTEIYIASTHYHPEHTSGYVAFPDSAQYVNSTVQEQEFAENGLALFARFATRSPQRAELLADAERRVADITFSREYTLDLGGVQVRFLVVGPTHTRGDTGFFVEGDNVLFAGDVVMNNSFLSANDGSSVTTWLAAFDAFEAMGPETIVPAHGEVGDGALISIQREVMLAIRARALELKAQGRSAEETGETVRAEAQAMHPTWGRVNGVASAARVAWNEAP